LLETERVHAKVRRYTSPDEEPFFPGAELPAPILPTMSAPSPIRANDICVNPEILRVYRSEIVPRLCGEGDDGHYGSSAVCDVACLQALSKRIHYGKFIAEAKYRESPVLYDRLIEAGDASGIRDELTVPAVEERLLERVRQKAAAYGQDLDGLPAVEPRVKIDPNLISKTYRNWIIPLTIDVEVDYLLACYG
jgi:chorismate mutase